MEEVIIKPSHKLGIVFNLTKKAYPQFTIDVILGEPNETGDAFVGKTEKVDISRYVETDKLSEEDKYCLLHCANCRKQRSINISAATPPSPVSGKTSFTRKKMTCRKRQKN
ncbi:MAG: hypothetical protein WDO71_03170 [Bacteroidota bacterium]